MNSEAWLIFTEFLLISPGAHDNTGHRLLITVHMMQNSGQSQDTAPWESREAQARPRREAARWPQAEASAGSGEAGLGSSLYGQPPSLPNVKQFRAEGAVHEVNLFLRQSILLFYLLI